MIAELEFLPMAERHILEIARLERECFSSPWTEEAFRSELKNPHASYLVAACGNRIVGYAGMHTVGEDGYVTNVAVSPEHRKCGVGTGLVGRLLSEAGSRGCSVLTLEVRASNGAARSLYRKHGFSAVGSRKGYYTLPDEDAVIMLKIL